MTQGTKRILLVKPPFRGLTYPGSPKGPELLKAAIRNSGLESAVEVRIVDLQLANQRGEGVPVRYLNEIRTYRPHLIGITNLSTQVNAANELARISKETAPGAVVVKGGYHESSAADWTMRLHRDVVDFCVGSDGSLTTRVEGEEAFVKIVRLLTEGGREKLTENLPTVPGAVYFEGSPPRLRMNPTAVIPKKALDTVFAANFEHTIEYDFPIFGMLPTAHAELSRGCPMRCNYCSAARANSNKVRLRSEASIRRQLKMLRTAGFKAFYADDANLTVNREWARMVARLLGSGDFVWGGNSRIDLLNRETILDFGRNGCRYLFTGLESGVKEVLLGMNKVSSEKMAERYLARAHEVYEWLSEAGIPSSAFLMFGGVKMQGGIRSNYVPESFEDVKESIRFAVSLPGVAYLSMNFLRLLPGTRFAEDPAFACIRPTGEKPLHGGYWDDAFYARTGEKDVRFEWEKHPEIYSCFELEDCMPVSTLANPEYMVEIVVFALQQIESENRRRKSGETKLQLVTGEKGKELVGGLTWAQARKA